MTFRPSGNVGIGTTSPDTLLNVEAAEGTNYADYITIIKNLDTTSGQGNGLKIQAGATSSDSLFYVTNRAGSAGYFLIRGDGNVGIGTTSPGRLLEALAPSGTTLFYGKSGTNTAASTFLIRNSDNTDLFDLDADGDLYLKGNVGIGATSPASTLSVGHNGDSNAAVYVNDGTNTGVAGWGTSEGIYGWGNDYGVYGSSPDQGVHGFGTYGVYGDSGATYGLYTPDTTYSAGGYDPFTGVHEVVLQDSQELKRGMIVSVTGKVKEHVENNSVDISTTMPAVELSNKANDKKVLGVFNEYKELGKEHWYYNYSSPDEEFGRVNALGEGRVLVTDINGEIRAGDYITTSDIPGYGQKQDDDLLHSYTLGKATENVEWEEIIDTVEYNGEEYKVYLIGVVYTSG
jgi:hypothetical protein